MNSNVSGSPQITSRHRFGRYRLDVMMTRFGALEGFVVDLENTDAAHGAVIVYQGNPDACHAWIARHLDTPTS